MTTKAEIMPDIKPIINYTNIKQTNLPDTTIVGINRSQRPPYLDGMFESTDNIPAEYTKDPCMEFKTMAQVKSAYVLNYVGR